jgi:hypothetical protein
MERNNDKAPISVIPAQAGGHAGVLAPAAKSWIPAFAGMTGRMRLLHWNGSTEP